jgi:AAA15 family ATPase/GTPase
MINSIDIRNFRCFKHLRIGECRRINVIVGDNGSGKTALLEAVFLTLSGNIEVSVRLRAIRGLEGSFSGSPRAIEEAIWRDYFYNLDWTREISVALEGSGREARSLAVSRGPRCRNGPGPGVAGGAAVPE